MRFPILSGGLALATLAAAPLARAEAPFYETTCRIGSAADFGTPAAFGIDVWSRRVTALGGPLVVTVFDREGYQIDRRHGVIARTRLKPGHLDIGSIEVGADAASCAFGLEQAVEFRVPRYRVECRAGRDGLAVDVRNEAADMDELLELHGRAVLTPELGGSFGLDLDADIAPGEQVRVAQVSAANQGPWGVVSACALDLAGALR